MNMPARTRSTRFWWVRHAPVDNPGGTIYGHLDLDALTEDPDAYAGLAALLPQEAVWVVSGLRRTRQTAEATLRARGGTAPELLVEPALGEQNFGDWQGRTHEEVFGELGRRHTFWLAPAATRAPNGESFADLAARASEAVLRLQEAHRGRDVIVFAHGGTIRAAVGMALGLDWDAALRLSVDNLSLSVISLLDIEGEPAAWRVDAVNVPPHLPVVRRVPAHTPSPLVGGSF
jgi:alpha-ribazole phosphatase